ncbi:MAG: phosphatase PAP2 family protein [Lachnospiraceae bacterium]|nr:phosphatase PAP2 family protein [Lachnospiraceae bacterium]
MYTAIYMASFQIMENARHVHYHVIHTWIDEQIPFCEYFVIPYILWFGLNVWVVAWFVLKAERYEYYRLITALMLGMTAFLVVSVVYPNRLELRPEHVDTTNICGRLVAMLYGTDTPTNVLPSIHVYNTVVLCHAVNTNARLRRRKLLILSLNTLGVLIILSTMFLKQHSVIDVSLGLVMGMLMQIISDRIFETEEERSFSKETVLTRSASSRRTAG